MRAIVSVYDKTGLVDFVRGLLKLNIELFSTGGTQRALNAAGLPVKSVQEITKFPEMLEGRVKTLHPAIYAGLLAKRHVAEHMVQLARQDIKPIDMVVVNLYPFGQTVSKPGVDLDEALENIDIGGPTLIRASAKNFPQVLVVVDPADYPFLLEQLQRGEVGQETRKYLAQKAFQHTASYDATIAQYLRGGEDLFPPRTTIPLKKLYQLVYGENPHQQAAFYEDEIKGKEAGPSLSSATLIAGSALSFNNICDLDAALSIVADFSPPTATIIKHGNPCGLACGQTLSEAYLKAYSGDPISAFGGVVGLNRRVDLSTAQEIKQTFYDAVIAAGYDDDALGVLQAKKDLKILAMERLSSNNSGIAPDLDFRRVSGGFLVQTMDKVPQDEVDLKVVTERGPALDELTDILFAWRAVKHVKSNAIVLVKRLTVVGVGAGQPNRAVSVKLALEAASERAVGSVLASDGFFPFPDGVELAGRGGVKAIIQPGGSIRDEQVIKMANRHRIAMVFTGKRHFKH
ncbi:MAG: bifunctional phosphoribosylaminoimidazolecarboxamide formyltransferase/IMP cyclohydrolase [Chloroflexi bacterium]|nr:bifunctional phosphoribosylaminoimidazolecarboxamide formyltransferase/IMP cyclohydrolase [Chloroflexota bacterium]